MIIPKKKRKAIQSVSVFDEIYRKETDSRNWTGARQLNGICNEPFFVEPPENWSDDETEMFDLMTHIEEKLKEKILEILEK